MSSLFKKSEEHYFETGMRHLSQRQYQEAEAAFSKGLQKYPASVSLHSGRANLWMDTGQFDRGAQDLSRALELQSEADFAEGIASAH